MSKEFIEAAVNASSLSKASEQEDQLSYFLESKIQEDRLDAEYLKGWAERKYQTNDYFLNWVKAIFKTENFLSFYKFLRYPLPSTKLIKNEIEPQLRRVFNAEDSDFRYDVTSADTSDFIDDLKIKDFNNEIFKKILYKHNSILISDLDPVVKNSPKRHFINIHNVISLEEEEGVIKRIAYKEALKIDDNVILGKVYIDSKVYAFYDKDNNEVVSKEHDLERCPAHFIVPNFMEDDCVIRESMFSYVREELEEYVFLKTLQRMTEPKGAIPVVTKILDDDEEDNGDGQEGPDLQPDSDHVMGSQQSKINSTNPSKGTGDLDAGTIHEVSPRDIQNIDGSINMDVVKNWINFHYMPIEALDYLNTRIENIERSIKSTIIGDVVESNEESKNKLQIEKSISVLENTLNSLSETINRIRKLSDTDMLGLKYGPKRVNRVFIHNGTDFFLESQSLLFEDLAKAPNSLERRNIIKRIGQNRHKNNPDQMTRQEILYDLMPFPTDKDFEVARLSGIVSDINMQFQLRFTYWITQFEAQYGNIVAFWKELGDLPKDQKLLFINNLIIEAIKKEPKIEPAEPTEVK